MFPFDLYVLSGSRKQETVDAFLVTYAGHMEEAAAEYPFPQYADHYDKVYHDIGSLVTALLGNPRMSYSLYFNSRNHGDPIQSAMLFFTTDGHLIAGLTVTCGQDQLDGYLQRLVNCVAGEWGYAVVETPPPLSKAEFVAEAERSPFSVSRLPPAT
jgi:hypothetical protein